MTWPKRSKSRPWVYGHRGVRGPVCAENTLPAFERALAEGADGIEFDVRLNHQGRVFVFHDATLERMTAGADPRALFDVSAEELKGVRLVDDGAIPALEDVLKWASDTELYLNIELKPDEDNAELLGAAVVNLVESGAAASVRSRILLSSFSSRVRMWVEGEGVAFPYGVLLEAGAKQLGTAPHFGCFGVHPNAESPLSRSQRGAWAFTNVWTVNDPERARTLDSIGVDGIITDRPGAIRSLFD